MCNAVGFVGSKCASVGTDTSAFFVSMKAAVCDSVHLNSFLYFSSSRSGSAVVLTSVVKSPSWLTRPINDRSSVKQLGVGNSAIALSLFGSVVIPSALIVNPTKFTSFSANTNLSAFRVMLCSLHRSSSARTRSTCCSKLSSKTIMSSMTFSTLRKPAMAMSPRLQYSSPVEESPMGLRKNWYRPQGVRNVVIS